MQCIGAGRKGRKGGLGGGCAYALTLEYGLLFTLHTEILLMNRVPGFVEHRDNLVNIKSLACERGLGLGRLYNHIHVLVC